MTTPAVTPPRPAGPFRWLRRLLVTALVLGVGLAALAWFAPLIVARTALKDRLLADATKDLRGTLTVAEVSLGWLSPVELGGVTLVDEAGAPAVTAGKVRTSRTLLQLARDHADLGTLFVDDATVHVVCTPGGPTNLETVLAKYLEPSGGAGGRPALEIEVHNAALEITEKGQSAVHRLDGLDATVSLPPGDGPVRGTLTAVSGTAGRGPLHARFALDPAGPTVGLTAADFPLETLGPLARRFRPGVTLGGRLTVNANVALGDATAFDGSASVSDLVFGDPALGGETLLLKQVTLKPTRLKLAGDDVTVESLDLTCDAGTLLASGAVNLSDAGEAMLAKPGVKLNLDLDAARLAGIMPKLLRLQPGTELQEGRLTLRLESKPGANGTDWAGGVTTTALRGTRAGKPLAWEKPLRVQFVGRLRPDRRPEFDLVECEAEFVGLRARGSQEAFAVAANIDLNRLAARLGEFVDLGGVRFGGTAQVVVQHQPRAGGAGGVGGFTTTATATLSDAHFADAAGRTLTEPRLTLTLNAAGRHTTGGPLALDAASLEVVAGADRLAAKLLEPVADLREPRTGKLEARLDGDLARWRGRAAPWAGIPADWQLAGQGPVGGVLTASDAGVSLAGGRADLVNVRFVGAGVDVSEPKLKLEAGATWTRATGDVTLTAVKAHCDTLVFDTPRLDVKSGGAVAFSATVTANVNRLQRTLRLQSDPADGDALNGLAIGTLNLAIDGPATRYDADFTIDKAMYGKPAKPVWREPWVKLRAKGTYGDDKLTLDAVALERDGFAATGAGSLGKLASSLDLDLAGTLAYDLARLEPQLKEFLGATARASGKDSRPFRVAGSLNAVNTLGATAGLSWQHVQAYGFDVGPAQLDAKLERGVLTTNPVRATFGGGKVQVEPRLDLNGAGTALTLAQGRVVERARLTPAALSSAVGYALPAFAGSTQADGVMSFDLEQNSIPLADAGRATLRGKLTVHEANVAPGPVVTEIATLLGAKQVKLTQPKEQTVPVRLENGRVYHENFTVTVGQTDIRSSGSVGLDNTLALTIDMPVPPKLLDKWLANNPRVREALSKRRVSLPVGGTLQRPTFDTAKLDGSIQALVRDALKDTFKSTATDLLRGELKKKLDPKDP